LSLESAENERKAREGPSATAAAPAPTAAPQAPTSADGDAMDVDDMDDDLRAAIALSLQSNPSESKAAEKPATTKGPDDMDVEDDDLAQALKLSKQTSSTDAAKGEKKEEGSGGVVDSNYMASVLLNLPGMDPNDPEVQEILKNMKAEQEKEEKEKKDKK